MQPPPPYRHRPLPSAAAPSPALAAQPLPPRRRRRPRSPDASQCSPQPAGAHRAQVLRALKYMDDGMLLRKFLAMYESDLASDSAIILDVRRMNAHGVLSELLKLLPRTFIIIDKIVRLRHSTRASPSGTRSTTRRRAYGVARSSRDARRHKASDSNRRAGQVHEAVHHHAQRGRRQHHPRGPADKPRLHHIAENVYIIIDKIVRLRHSTRAFHRAELVLQLEDGHMESHAHLGTPPSPRPRTRTVAPGKCMKLYTTMLREVEDSTIPEVQRTNLDSVCGLMSPPAETLIRRARSRARSRRSTTAASSPRWDGAWPSFRWTHS